jgi:hypothetical protein
MFANRLRAVKEAVLLRSLCVRLWLVLGYAICDICQLFVSQRWRAVGGIDRRQRMVNGGCPHTEPPQRSCDGRQ